MGCLDFGKKLWGCIRVCLVSSWSSLITLIVSPLFSLASETRKSLSSFLCVLAIEGLHVTLVTWVFLPSSMWMMCYFWLIGPMVTCSHFFYVDDVLFLADWPQNNVDNSMSVIWCFLCGFVFKYEKKSIFYRIGVN